MLISLLTYRKAAFFSKLPELYASKNIE